VSRIVPVAYFAYRRADLVTRTLAALRANGVTQIYAFADAARSPEDEADVAAVRRILHAVDWADMRVVERPVNLGVDVSEPRGISEVFAAHEEIVVCEDDIEMVPGTYQYLLAALERYRSEPRVMSISAWTHPRVTPADAGDAPHFTGRFPCWGWASWRRAWDGFPESSLRALADRCAARGIDVTRYGDDIARALEAHPDKLTWDFAFSLHVLAHDGLSLMPARTMTAHIGRDGRATHPQDLTDWVDHPESPPRDIRWPDVRENPGSAECWRREVNAPPSPSLAGRIRRRLATLIDSRASREPRP
jgi:hypothetical protein